MFNRLVYLSLFSVSLFLWNSTGYSGETVAPIEHKEELTIDLSDIDDKTFFEVMTMDGGIEDKLDEQQDVKFRVPGRTAALAALKKFSSKVNSQALRVFRGKRDAYAKFVADKLSGNTYTNTSLERVFQKAKKTPWDIARYLTIVSGGDLLVQIDDNNYYYNAGYEKGNVKSGRSYAAGPSHAADDASYPFYLRMLRGYFLTSEKELEDFYTALMEILVQTDTSHVAKLSSETQKVTLFDGGRKRNVRVDGQSVISDFVAVYTAELYRHLITNLRRHDWENALLELTLLAAYTEEAGILQNTEGKIVKGTLSDWRYVGSQGSGIGGISGRNRRSFQRKVCKAASQLKLKSLAALRRITGKGSDCFRAISTLLNNYKTQDKVSDNADKLRAAVVDFVMDLRERADEITKLVPGTPR